MATTQSVHTGNNTAVDFPFTFPYLKESDIKVSLDGVDQSLTTHYTLHNATTIRFETAPGTGKIVRIYRNTASNSLASTFYPGSAIRSSDLNDNYTQNLYVTQEGEYDTESAKDYAIRFIINGDGSDTTGTEQHPTIASRHAKPQGVPYAITTANSAVTTANSAETKADSAVSTANSANSTAATANSTASNANTTSNTANTNATNAVNTANTASTNATNAVNTANAADAIADSAKLATDRLVATTSNDGATWTLTGNNTNASTDPKGVGYAVTTAESATTTANSATSTANSATSTANTANTTANTAKDATDKVVATFNSGNNTWTLQGNNTNAATDPKGVGYAVTQAEAAVTTANSAAASVAAAQLYTIVANYAALPTISSSNHEDFYQVTDSTAISRSSGTFSPTTVADPNSQAPNDFQGDDELTVKLRANNTSGKWEWQEYYANDSESRYRKKVIVENKNSISENYTIGANNNAFSVGPVTIANGYTVTIPANQLYFVN